MRLLRWLGLELEPIEVVQIRSLERFRDDCLARQPFAVDPFDVGYCRGGIEEAERLIADLQQKLVQR